MGAPLPKDAWSLPGEGVGRTARIGSGGEHAGVRIAMGHHRADAARADLGHPVAEGPELAPRVFGNARLHVELAGLVGARIVGVDEGLSGGAGRVRRLLWIHAEEQHV